MCKLTSLLVVAVYVFAISTAVFGDEICITPLTDTQVKQAFHRLARKQLTLDFGADVSFDRMQVFAVSPALARVDAAVRFRKPGKTQSEQDHIAGWVSRCDGTVIINNHTWLRNGRLKVPSYQKTQLAGRGIVLGRAQAPLKVIAFVDSRCPHCHRLIEYAKNLIDAGELQIEYRQVAYLENSGDAVTDTQLHATALVNNTSKVDDVAYLEMLGGENASDHIDQKNPSFLRAVALIEENSHVARKVLGFSTVPGVLIYDADLKGYRKTSYWEMNRLFQPDL